MGEVQAGPSWTGRFGGEISGRGYADHRPRDPGATPVAGQALRSAALASPVTPGASPGTYAPILERDVLRPIPEDDPPWMLYTLIASPQSSRAPHRLR